MVGNGSGSIVLTASTAGLKANAGSAPYSASKAGVISLAQTAANSFLGTGVRVNAICPGLIETGMTRDTFAARARTRYAPARSASSIRCSAPARRKKSPPWRCFLPATSRSYVNGQAFPVDGGLSSTLPFRRPIR